MKHGLRSTLIDIAWVSFFTMNCWMWKHQKHKFVRMFKKQQSTVFLSALASFLEKKVTGNQRLSRNCSSWLPTAQHLNNNNGGGWHSPELT